MEGVGGVGRDAIKSCLETIGQKRRAMDHRWLDFQIQKLPLLRQSSPLSGLSSFLARLCPTGKVALPSDHRISPHR